MKSLILVVVTFFAFNASSDIQISGIQGATSIQGTSNALLITVDAYSSKELVITFLSTETMGVPRLTYISPGGAAVLLPTVSDKLFTTALNQEVTLRIPANVICTQLSDEPRNGCSATALKIGIDGSSDGDLEDASDDALTFSLVF